MTQKACSAYWLQHLKDVACNLTGACSAGVDSIFITGGIHAKDIASTDGEFDEQKLLKLFQQHQGEPTFTMPSLRV